MTQTSKNILLVSGSGQNVGKTSFICRMITQYTNRQPVAIKITPHFHHPSDGLRPVIVTDNYRIFQETDPNTTKDSSRFLHAGAKLVFYIQTTDAFLKEAFMLTSRQIAPDQPVIIESAALRKFITPGLYLFIQKKYEEVKPSALEMQKLADSTVFSDGECFSIQPERIIFDQTWKIKQDDNA